jgi:hypothetical protein
MKESSVHRRPVRSSLRTGLLFAAGLASACHDSESGSSAASTEFLEHWSMTAVDTSGVDHMPTNEGRPHTQGEQAGPCRSSRAMAIVHLAIWEAINAIEGDYQSTVGLAPAAAGTSMRAAVGQAAHDTLAALFPSQSAFFAADLQSELAKTVNNPGRAAGLTLGAAAAQAVLAARAGDGADHDEPRYGIEYIAGDAPGEWRQDPISLHPLALGGLWPTVTPFVLASADQFRLPPPPALTSAEYQLAYEEVKVLGGDGITTATARTDEGTEVGIFWAYDGTPSLCAPPRLYNQIAMQIAKERGLGLAEMARLLALANVAMADAGIAAWDSKYFYKYWRPVTGIRESDPGTGPSGLGDGNPNTIGDPSYSPLGAQASNTLGPNFTPPFPAYPSGHATFGAALFQVLRRFFGTDEIPFTFVSDEFNGVTADANGNVRPMVAHSFRSLAEAEEENGQSRIYLGIHWSFDKTSGITLGRQVGDLVFDTFLQPTP